jgi:hypothetical protein
MLPNPGQTYQENVRTVALFFVEPQSGSRVFNKKFTTRAHVFCSVFVLFLSDMIRQFMLKLTICEKLLECCHLAMLFNILMTFLPVSLHSAFEDNFLRLIRTTEKI